MILKPRVYEREGKYENDAPGRVSTIGRLGLPVFPDAHGDAE